MGHKFKGPTLLHTICSLNDLSWKAIGVEEGKEKSVTETQWEDQIRKM